MSNLKIELGFQSNPGFKLTLRFAMKNARLKNHEIAKNFTEACGKP